MTPISKSLASFFTRWSGYELNHKVTGPSVSAKTITTIKISYNMTQGKAFTIGKPSISVQQN